ncbi:DUF2946 family protein [Shimia sp.]|uniref:DUF2946 family protein n=1 Tax=Shimia sp. TaxID=1954381 RepID=UPI0035661C38
MLISGTTLTRVFRLPELAGLMAVFALVLQLLAPSLASATQGEWIEICSEYGIVLQQIAPEDGTLPSQESGYGDCEDCAFCAFAAPLSPASGAGFELIAASAAQTSRHGGREVGDDAQFQWPESRGPPSAKTFLHAERDPRMSKALTSNKGGALWT